ncbi:MAG: phosphoribosylformylglycinamidine cyclo-ligase [Clostridiales Family XIII bacterium]|jgi:phosphoribosylformylglycinamidine cyclo-ligase|nr:phosphoribosylformylglycinamidine cyclo-ligase [Clostridiales Family XIII bacterium]
MEGKLTYKEAGVDTKEGERAVKLMREHARKTFDAGVLAGIGGFGSLYAPDMTGICEPVLVAGSDGVGTKLLVAFLMNKHDTVGQDCVAMCVNDVLCQGAKPLFFLDYIATGHVDAEKVASIVKGVADGCILGQCALVGGETAEMPGLYKGDDYDMAGFCVGLADKSRIIDGKTIKEGDKIIGIASSGLHSNGFSLARKVLFEKAGLTVKDRLPELGGAGASAGFDSDVSAGADSMTVGDVLLTPTRIYTKQVRAILERIQPKGFVHITGGGFFENIPRIMPAGLGARIRKDAWERSAIFDVVARLGEIDEKEMFSTFNMGIGLMAVVNPAEANTAIDALAAVGEDARVIGEVSLGSGVTLW